MNVHKECGNLKEEYRIGYEIRMIHNMIAAHANHNRNKMSPELTQMQAWVIGYLYCRRDGDTYQKDIEEEFNISRATATNLLQLMEKKELVVRASVEHDKRLKKIYLTDKSIGYHEYVLEDIKMMEKLLVEGMSEEEIRQLKRLLLIMHGNVERKLQDE